MHHHHHDDADALGISTQSTRPPAGNAERGIGADVPLGVMVVLFRRGGGALSAGSVSFPFPLQMACRFPALFTVSPLPPNVLRGAHVHEPLTIGSGLFHAHCHDWHGLCGAGVRRLLCGFRPPCDLRRQGCRQDRRPSSRRNPDLRARPGCAGGGQRESQTAGFHHRPDRPVAEADAVFIAVGTPSRRGDGHADLTYVYGAAREIVEDARPPKRRIKEERLLVVQP